MNKLSFMKAVCLILTIYTLLLSVPTVTLAAEEIHNLYDERWKAACEDVYEYSKGEIYG